MERKVERIITAHKQLEGGGFEVRRPLPSSNLEHLDPFLLIDELGPVEYAPGKAVGAPDHPHRGFETVTYILEGAVEHEDSAGHRGRIGPGDVQWMTAGAGIIHSEEPSSETRAKGGRAHGFQIWVNLPARLKMTTPRYQELPAAKLPRARSADGRARGVIIAGEALGVRAAIATHTPIVYQDWSLEEGGEVQIDIAPDHRVLVYAFQGAADISGRRVEDGQLAVLGDGSSVRLRGASAGRVLLLAGVPHREPVARYGPFVMNTQQELLQAFDDYRSGRMGEITRTARVV
jgi:redox-sensitive bicupin YhaK (pirin superfamily)